MLVAHGVESMLASGNQGGNPVLSKPGKETVAHYVCFQEVGGERKPAAERKPPQHIARDNIKNRLTGNVADVPRLWHEEQVRLAKQKIEELRVARASQRPQIKLSACFKNEGRESHDKDTLDKFYNTSTELVRTRAPTMVKMQISPAER